MTANTEVARSGGRLWQGLTLQQKQVVWAWGFLAVPILFYGLIRFYPTVEAFIISTTNWNLMSSPAFVGLANFKRLMADPVFWQVFRNTFLYLDHRHAAQPRARLHHRLPSRPRALHARLHPGALLPALSDHGNGDGLGLALVLPAGADRPDQRPAVVASASPSSPSCARRRRRCRRCWRQRSGPGSASRW
jgi:hypothetical protein